jgi:hypothetical protein
MVQVNLQSRREDNRRTKTWFWPSLFPIRFRISNSYRIQTLDCILLLSLVPSNQPHGLFFQGKNQQAVSSKDAEVQTEQANCSAQQSDFSSDSPWTNSTTFPPEPSGALNTLLHVEAASLLGMMSLSWL